MKMSSNRFVLNRFRSFSIIVGFLNCFAGSLSDANFVGKDGFCLIMKFHREEYELNGDRVNVGKTNT